MGFEPTYPFGHQPLKLARMPFRQECIAPKCVVRAEGIEPPSPKKQIYSLPTPTNSDLTRIVRSVGLEPTRPFGQQGLSLPRLPSSAKNA